MIIPEKSETAAALFCEKANIKNLNTVNNSSCSRSRTNSN